MSRGVNPGHTGAYPLPHDELQLRPPLECRGGGGGENENILRWLTTSFLTVSVSTAGPAVPGASDTGKAWTIAASWSAIMSKTVTMFLDMACCVPELVRLGSPSCTVKQTLSGSQDSHTLFTKKKKKRKKKGAMKI